MPHRAELIDFTGQTASRWITPQEGLSEGGIHVLRGVLKPNPGGHLATRHLAAVVHQGRPAEVNWRKPGEMRLRSVRAGPGTCYVSPANRPIFLRWTSAIEVIVMAFDDALVDEVAAACGRSGEELAMAIGVRDLDIERAAREWRRELAEGEPGGSVFTQGLGTTVLVHLIRTYGKQRRSSKRGGLGPERLAKVVDHIEGNLVEDISIATLASIAGLSPHHFSGAFKRETGLPPHRFLMERRVERARLMLKTTDAPITSVATALGFSSPSHFTVCFRRLTGSTPTRFRDARS